MGGSEKDLPDLKLQRVMLLDGMTNHKTPWTVVLLTGDGAGWAYGKWFLPTLKGMKEGGWNIELISWSQSCNRWLREWVIQNGQFTSLDDFYRSVTFLVPSENLPEWAPRHPCNCGGNGQALLLHAHMTKYNVINGNDGQELQTWTVPLTPLFTHISHIHWKSFSVLGPLI